MALTKVSYSMIQGAWANVLDYGADATGATDSAAAIQGAIDAVSSAGGGTVYLPSGTYKVNTTIAMKKKVSIEGSGKGTYLYQQTSPCTIDFHGSGSCFLFTTTDASNDIQVTNIHLDGTNSSAGAYGIYLHETSGIGAVQDVNFIGVSVTNFPGHQVYQNGTVFDITWRDCGFSNYSRASGDSYRTGPDGVPGQLTFDHCYFVNCTPSTWAYSAETVDEPRFIGGTVGPGSSSGWGISARGYLYISGTHIEGTGGLYGVLYKGTEAYISPSLCFGFDTGILIGDGSADLAVGYTICSFAGGNTTADIIITPGGSRNGTITDVYGTILNQRWTTDKANEVAIVGSNFGTASGTFTPTVEGGSVAGVGTYTYQSAMYQNAGLSTTFSLNVTWSGHTGSGALLVGTLPRNAGFTTSVFPVYWSGLSITSGNQLVAIVGNNNKLTIKQISPSGTVSDVALTGSGQVIISGTYFTYL